MYSSKPLFSSLVKDSRMHGDGAGERYRSRLLEAFKIP